MIAAAVLAVALAIDAAAAAAVCGLRSPYVRAADALRVATLTGAFQAAMAALGWVGGRALGDAFARWDHWIAFGLLAAFGLKTILGALRDGAPDDGGAAPADVFGWRPLVVLAFATSIDALAAGVTLPLLASPPPAAIALIGGVTFALVLVAVHAGRAIATRAGRGLEVLGGVALIAIGVKILVEHLA